MELNAEKADDLNSELQDNESYSEKRNIDEAENEKENDLESLES